MITNPEALKINEKELDEFKKKVENCILNALTAGQYISEKEKAIYHVQYHNNRGKKEAVSH